MQEDMPDRMPGERKGNYLKQDSLLVTTTTTTANTTSTSTNTQPQAHSHKHTITNTTTTTTQRTTTTTTHNHSTQPEGPQAKSINTILTTMATCSSLWHQDVIEMSWWGSLEVK